jgi:hypothetical protein
MSDSHFQRWQDVPEIVMSLIFCPADQRQRWQLMSALMCELLEAAFGLSDERPARVKLEWWQQEAEAACRASPQHPLTAALDELGEVDFSALPEAILALLEGLDSARPANFEALMQQHLQWSLALARMLQGKSAHSTEVSGNAAALAYWSVFWQLRYAMKANRYGPGVLPMDLAARHQLRSKQLSEASEAASTQAVRALLQQFVDWPLSNRMTAEMAALHAATRAQAQHAARHWLPTQHSALLGERYSSLRLRPRFGMLWQCWRAARRAYHTSQIRD